LASKKLGFLSFISGMVLGILLGISKIADILFLIFNLLFALSYWMTDAEYVLMLQVYIVFICILIVAALVSRWQK